MDTVELARHMEVGLTRCKQGNQEFQQLHGHLPQTQDLSGDPLPREPRAFSKVSSPMKYSITSPTIDVFRRVEGKAETRRATTPASKVTLLLLRAQEAPCQGSSRSRHLTTHCF